MWLQQLSVYQRWRNKFFKTVSCNHWLLIITEMVCISRSRYVHTMLIPFVVHCVVVFLHPYITCCFKSCYLADTYWLGICLLYGLCLCLLVGIRHKCYYTVVRTISYGIGTVDIGRLLLHSWVQLTSHVTWGVGSFRLIVCKQNTSVNILFIINNIVTYALRIELIN